MLRMKLCVAVATILFSISHAGAREWMALHLYEFVEYSDLVAFGTVVDDANGVIRIDEVLKGKSDRTIRLVETVDPFARSEDQKNLINGTRELLFLRQKAGAFAPLQILAGRWRVTDDGLFVTRGAASVSGPTVAIIRQKIQLLTRLQSDATHGANAVDAYIRGLRSNDDDARLWAALKVNGSDIKSDRLLDELLRLWQTHGEARGTAANLIVRMRARRVAPLMAERLRLGDDGERVSAVRALGGTGDTAHVDMIRTVAASDPSELVRADAYEGLAHLLGADAVDDLRRGAVDPTPRVRAGIPVHAYNLVRRLGREDVSRVLRQVAETLRDDPDPSVSGNARHVLALWDKP